MDTIPHSMGVHVVIMAAYQMDDGMKTMMKGNSLSDSWHAIIFKSESLKTNAPAGHSSICFISSSDTKVWARQANYIGRKGIYVFYC